MISVIVPVYKVEPYLRRCIDSIIEQTHRDLEIILVDDGSPDNCGAICEEYAQKDSRIQVFHKPNGGLSDARNYGVAHSHGEYILFVDSDDYVSVELVGYLYTILCENHADISCCTYIKTSNDCEEFYLKNDDFVVIDSGQLACEKQMTTFHFMTTAWAKLIKRELVIDNPFPKGRNHEDVATTYKYYYNAERVVVSRNKLYAYFINPNGISYSLTSKNANEVLTAWEERLDYFNNRNQWKLYEIAQKTYIYEYLEYKNQFDLPDRDKRHLKSVFRNKKVSLKMKLFIGAILCFGERVTAVFPSVIAAVDWLYSQQEKLFSIVRYCWNIWRKDAVLFDTPEHGNIGDQAIAVAEAKFLADRKISYTELTGLELSRSEKLFSCLTPKNKIVYVHGGGFLGCLYPMEEYRFRRILENYPDHRIVVFPQTITFDLDSDDGLSYFQESKKIYEGHKNLIIFVREKQSYSFMAENMPCVDVRLVPDIAMSLQMKIDCNDRNGILLCLRNDPEKLLDNQSFMQIQTALSQRYPFEERRLTDTFVNSRIFRKQRIMMVENKLQEFRQSKLVITDRLHGVLFALLTGTPCIAFGNSNGKVKGVFQWIEQNSYIQYADNISDFERILEHLDINKVYEYDRGGLADKFNGLEDVLSQCRQRKKR